MKNASGNAPVTLKPSQPVTFAEKKVLQSEFSTYGLSDASQVHKPSQCPSPPFAVRKPSHEKP